MHNLTSQKSYSGTDNMKVPEEKIEGAFMCTDTVLTQGSPTGQ